MIEFLTQGLTAVQVASDLNSTLGNLGSDVQGLEERSLLGSLDRFG